MDWATKIRFRPEIALTRFEFAKLLLAEAENTGESLSAAALRTEGEAHLEFAINEFPAMKMQPALKINKYSRLSAFSETGARSPDRGHAQTLAAHDQVKLR